MTTLPIAAIVYTPDINVEALLVRVARELLARGIRLGGVIQHDIATAINDPCAMELEDLSSGERFSLSQELGSGSEACRLDPAALAHASVAVRTSIEAGAQLIMINKFGAQEANGDGLRDEMGLAVVSGTPLLTAVGKRFMPEWQAFTDGEGCLLEPSYDSIIAWWDDLSRAD